MQLLLIFPKKSRNTNARSQYQHPKWDKGDDKFEGVTSVFGERVATGVHSYAGGDLSNGYRAQGRQKGHVPALSQ